MTYSATDIVLIIGAIGVMVTGIITAWRTSAKVDVATAKIDSSQTETAKKLEEIHLSTNGNLSKLTEKLEALEQKSLLDNDNVKALQEIVKNLTGNTAINTTSVPVDIVKTIKK